MTRSSALRLIAPAFSLLLAGLACDSNDGTKPDAPAAHAAAKVGAPGAVHGQPGAAHGQPAMPPGHPPTGAAAMGAGGAKAGGRPKMSMGQVKAPEPSAAREVTPSAEVRPLKVPGLSLSVPTQWTQQKSASPMRAAQFDIPGPGGGASFVIFRFPGGGGNAQANVDRWLGQIQQPDGRPTKDVASVETSNVGDLKLTSVDAVGTYTAAMVPGGAEHHESVDTRMLAVIVEGTGNPHFFKVVGPKTTVDPWMDAWKAALASMKAAP